MSAKLSLSGVLRSEAIMAHTCSSNTAGGMRCRKSARLCGASDSPTAVAMSWPQAHMAKNQIEPMPSRYST